MPAPYLPNYQAVAARAAGGTLGGPAGTTGQVYGTRDPYRLNAKKGLEPYNVARTIFQGARERANYGAYRERGANEAYDAALADPTKQAGIFRNIYQDTTNALASPVMRQFQMNLSNNRGDAASRFYGGLGSTEQGRGEFNTSDLFSRNLSEIIRGQAGEAVNAGLQYTGELGQRARDAGSVVDNSTNTMLAAGADTKKPKGGLGSFVGGVLGGGVGALLGNPGFGTALGNRIFGGNKKG